MRRDLIGYVLFFVASLGLAYYASVPTSDSDSRGKDWAKIEPKLIKEVRYQSAAENVTLTYRDDIKAFFAHIESKTSPEAAGDFRVNERMQDILNALNPLEAQRVVGKASDQDLEEYGLKGEVPQIEVKSSEDSLLKLAIGKKSYGSNQTFVQDQKDGRVILINGNFIDLLIAAKTQLIERRLSDLRLEDIASVRLQAGAQAATIVPGPRDKDNATQWRFDREGSEPQAPLRTWLEKLSKISSLNYAPASETEALKGRPVLAQMVLQGSNDVAHTVKFIGVHDPLKKEDFWVWSSFLGSYIRVPASQADTLVKDLPALLRDQK